MRRVLGVLTIFVLGACWERARVRLNPPTVDFGGGEVTLTRPLTVSGGATSLVIRDGHLKIGDGA